jgi:eukaryotic-like serine/threonine-protein kinase
MVPSALQNPFVNAASPSSKFGKYELLDRIAAGGMAEIYRARYEPVPGVSKQVVIKKILPHYAANKAFVAMFTNEARIAISLSHGNIAQVFDFGTIEGDSYLAMELVDGPPLSKVIRRTKAAGIPVLPLEMAAWVTAEMLDGLHYAHSRLDERGRPLHIVHRDISPQNVLLSFEGQVKIVDFGIAHARTSAEEPGNAAVKGKYSYFAPEQARGLALDGRTDIFAAGIMLYELVTGDLPFQGKMMEAMTRIVKGQYYRPSERNPRVDEMLERIIVKALALQPADRYQTALAFKEDLSRYLISHYPNFTPSRLSQFLQYLFEDELVAQGRPVQLPAEFIRRVEDWKEPLPETALVPLPPAEPEAMLTHDNPISSGAPLPTEHGRSNVGGWLRPLGLGVASVAVGVAAVLVLGRMSRATLELSSVPAGAAVTLDGVALGAVTPLQVAGLDGNTKHEVKLELNGYLAWVNSVPLKRGQTLIVNADLLPVPPPPPVAPEPEPPPEPPPPVPPPPAPTSVQWPLSSFELDLSAHRTTLRDATIIDLDVTRTYRVSLSRGSTFGWGFSVVNAAGASVGPLTSAPMSISAAQRLYLFRARPETLAARSPDERRARLLTLRYTGGKPVVTPILPTLPFASEQRVTVTGLDTKKVYRLTVQSQLGAPATILGATSAGLFALPVGGSATVKKAASLWLTVLDDGSFTASGRLTIELREVPKS